MVVDAPAQAGANHSTPAGPVLVTGASGFVGRHLLARCSGPVVAWRRRVRQEDASNTAVNWQTVDLADRASVMSHIGALRPVRIFHLAGAPSVRTSWQNPVPHLRTNVLGTHHLLEALRVAGHPCRVLVVSSAQVYAASNGSLDEDAPLGPPSPYGLSKLAEEQLALRVAHDDGLDVVVARPFNHIGPGQAPEFAIASFARQVARIEAGLDPPTLRVGNLTARRDMTDVRDVVDAYVLLMARAMSGRTYNVCSGRAPSIQDLLEELVAQSSVSVSTIADPERLRPNDVPLILGDGSRLRDELGWAPTIPLSRSLRDTLDAWRREVGRSS